MIIHHRKIALVSYLLCCCILLTSCTPNSANDTLQGKLEQLEAGESISYNSLSDLITYLPTADNISFWYTGGPPEDVYISANEFQQEIVNLLDSIELNKFTYVSQRGSGNTVELKIEAQEQQCILTLIADVMSDTMYIVIFPEMESAFTFSGPLNKGVFDDISEIRSNAFANNPPE